jgi:hypothetical protein
MEALNKMLRDGMISFKELAVSVGINEEILSEFPINLLLNFETRAKEHWLTIAPSSIDEEPHCYWNL